MSPTHVNEVNQSGPVFFSSVTEPTYFVDKAIVAKIVCGFRSLNKPQEYLGNSHDLQQNTVSGCYF